MSTTKTNNVKLYSIVNSSNYVTDAWWAESTKEAQEDNPGMTIVKMTVENSPASIGWYWDGKNFRRNK